MGAFGREPRPGQRRAAALLDVVVEKLDALSERPLRIRVLGRFGGFPERLQQAIDRAEARTAENPGLHLNIALGYSGRDELVDACRAMLRALVEEGVPPDEMAARVTHEALAAHLYTAGRPDPDLIIRTSGELRLSGFLPWQSAHSEFYFTDVDGPPSASSIFCARCAPTSSACAGSGVEGRARGRDCRRGRGGTERLWRR